MVTTSRPWCNPDQLYYHPGYPHTTHMHLEAPVFSHQSTQARQGRDGNTSLPLLSRRHRPTLAIGRHAAAVDRVVAQRTNQPQGQGQSQGNRKWRNRNGSSQGSNPSTSSSNANSANASSSASSNGSGNSGHASSAPSQEPAGVATCFLSSHSTHADRWMVNSLQGPPTQ